MDPFRIAAYRGRSRHAIASADGSEAEMCGNGIRCLVMYAVDAGYVKRGSVTVKTKAGVREVTAKKSSVIVDMGKPRFGRSVIPALGTGSQFVENMHGWWFLQSTLASRMR